MKEYKNMNEGIPGEDEAFDLFDMDIDALDDETLNVPKVEWCSPSDLEYNSRTGKLKIIIDRRL